MRRLFSKPRWGLVAVGFLLCGLLFYGYLRGFRRSVETHVADSSVPSVPTLAVFSIENDTGHPELDWLREGIADMILTDLSHTGKWQVLSREKTHALLEDGKWSRTVGFGKMLNAARSIHATAFLCGNVSIIGKQIHLRLEAHDGKDGHLISSDEVTLNDPLQIVAGANYLATGIAQHLGFAEDTTVSLADSMTSNVEAYRYYSVGVEKAEQFQNTQAIQYFKKAIEFDPHFAMAFARIGYSYAVRDFQYEKGRQYLEQAMRLSEHLPELNQLYIKAWYAIARSDYSSAVRLYEQITRQAPDETEAYCQMGRVLRGQERLEEAANLLRSAIQKHPNSGDLYNTLGMILSSLRQLPEALDTYRQYAVLEPQNPNSHDSLGMAYQQLGQYEAALAEYGKALSLDPEFEPSISHLGDTYYQQGRYNDASREYRRYIQVSQGNDAKALGYEDLATVYWTIGKQQEAQVAATAALRYNRNAAWSSLVIALEKHQAENANRLEKTLFANLPNFERGSQHNYRTEFFYRGYIELKKGNRQEAIHLFKTALQHFPPSSGIDAYEDCLANAYLELGNLTDAVAEYQRVLKINPNYPLVYFHLGEAYEKLHDSRNASAAYRHFLQANPAADQDSPQIVEAKRKTGVRES